MSAFRKLSSIYVFSCFPFGFEGRIWDLIVSVPDHCLSFYFEDSEKSVFTTKVQETEDMPLPEHLQEMYNCSVEKLSCEEAKLLKGLLLRHANVFSKSKSDLGNCRTILRRINT